jgi:hypothetical protein
MWKLQNLVLGCYLASLTLTQGNAASKADLSKLVVVGDSLSAGFQNGSLLGSQQVNGYAALVAEGARVALPLPLIAEPGIPNVLYLVDPGPPPIIETTPGVSAGRVDYSVQPMNLAVPGHTVRDALDTRPDLPVDSLTDLVLGLPGMLGGVSRSQMEWAEALNPTTVICWLGNNDTLGPAMAGDATLLTPLDEFRAAFDESMRRLGAKNVTIVVANIPDVSAIPYFTSAEKLALQIGLPLETIGPLLGLQPGSFVTPEAFPLIQQILGGAPGPLPGAVVLDPAEVAQIRQATDAYNATIAAEAKRYGAALVDIHALFARIMTHGFEVGGRRLSTEFLGGIFSLDGIHPTNTGYAIIANEFIHALNSEFAAGIVPVSIEQVFKGDPLAPGRVAAGSALGHVRPEMARAVRKVIVH